MRKLLTCFTVLSVIGLMVACNGRRPSTETNNTDDAIVLSETNDIRIKSDMDVVIDTIDLKTYCNLMDSLTVFFKGIHINSIADTVLLRDDERMKALLTQLKISDSSDFVPDREMEDWTHSERVRVYQSLLSGMTEMYRINEELKAVGAPLQSRIFSEREEKVTVEFIEALKIELDKELN